MSHALPITEHPECKLNAEQIENILDKLVPMIAAPEDHGFFRGILAIKLQSETSGTSAAFIAKLLRQWASNNAPGKANA